jgi:hypothetical protein
MSRFIEGRTKYCIAKGCVNPATSWHGILVKSRDAILCGWCRNHKETECPKVFNIPDCYGVYDKSIELKTKR